MVCGVPQPQMAPWKADWAAQALAHFLVVSCETGTPGCSLYPTKLTGHCNANSVGRETRNLKYLSEFADVAQVRSQL